LQTLALRTATLRGHLAVHEAIGGHDARAACSAMHRHLS